MKPRLLLHSCCAPCLSAVFEQLKDDYDITLFWFNPNIYPMEESAKRLNELVRYAKIIDCNVVIQEKYLDDHHNWIKLTQELSNEKEGGKRCEKCMKYRLLATAVYAERFTFDFFATTLSISPHKNSDMINTLGNEISQKFDVKFLDHDFKENNAYNRSIKICQEMNIYRQKYCGCEYSIRS